MLTKEESFEVTVYADGQLGVKKITSIYEDGVVISSQNHRHVVDVGGDVSAESEVVREIAGLIHTPARLAARNAFKESQRG